jgi:putative ABC transport system permease protein
MKSESPKAGKRILLERLPLLWKRFTFSQKLILKNVFRNKKRGALVLIGISLSYAMMLFTTSMPGAVDDMMNDHYVEFQKMDYIVGFKTPVRQSAINGLAHLIDIDYMEGKLEYPFEFENGNRTQIVSVIGLKGDTEFYSFKRADGTGAKLPASGALISENMADNLNLKAGDTVKLNTFIPGKDSVYVEVKDVITQTLGSNAYMEIGYMGKKLMEKNAVNGVYLNSSDENIYTALAKVPGIASVMSVSETRAAFEEYMGAMNASIGFMVVFSGILGFCIVYNATSIIIGEREMEFSALRVLGLSGNEIFKMILSENNLLLLAGIITGIPVGISFLSSMSTIMNTDMYTFKMAANFQAVMAAAALTALFVFFAQFATYQKVKRLDLLAALKNRMN